MLILSHVTVVRDNKPILEDISLEIASGSIHALMGPNRSGKSTLAMTLMGYPGYDVIKGSVKFNDTDLLALSLEQRARAGLFLACQQPPAVPGVQVFTFLKEAHRMLTKHELAVTEFKEILYNAFDAVKLDHSFAYRNLHEGFSGGEKKRLEMAQLMLFKPQCAIIDEIDSGLDIDARTHIALVLSKIAQTGTSLLVITHYNRMLEALQPQYVHILSGGKLWGSGGFELAQKVEQKGYDGLFA